MRAECRRAFAFFLVALAPSSAWALQELDRQYELETIGVLRSWDNADGFFADHVGAAYKDYFTQQARFVYVDMARASELMQKSKLAYSKLIEDPEVLGTAARALRAQTILRTKVYKEGPTYRFVIDWMLSPRMEILSNDTFRLEELNSGRSYGLPELRLALHQSLERLFKKLPFSAQVSGRDGNLVTVNLGDKKVQKGDALIVSTIEEVRKHPILKNIAEWRFAKTGRLEVESVDGSIAFCRVTEEEEGRQVMRNQKITHVVPAPDPMDRAPVAGAGADGQSAVVARDQSATPKYGWASGGLWVGGFSRDYNSGGTSAQTLSGGGFLVGAQVDGQLWLTRDWFFEAGFSYGFSGYSQKNVASQATSAAGTSTSVVHASGAFGYTHYLEGRLMGPKAWAKAGFHGTSYTLPVSNTNLTGPSSFSGLFLGLGGDLPLREPLGLLFTLDLGVLKGAEETGMVSSTISGSTDVSFFAGAYYKFDPRMSARAGIDVMIHGADFSNGGSLSHKVISFGPSLLYYF